MASEPVDSSSFVKLAVNKPLTVKSTNLKCATSLQYIFEHGIRCECSGLNNAVNCDNKKRNGIIRNSISISVYFSVGVRLE